MNNSELPKRVEKKRSERPPVVAGSEGERSSEWESSASEGKGSSSKKRREEDLQLNLDGPYWLTLTPRRHKQSRPAKQQQEEEREDVRIGETEVKPPLMMVLQQQQEEVPKPTPVRQRRRKGEMEMLFLDDFDGAYWTGGHQQKPKRERDEDSTPKLIHMEEDGDDDDDDEDDEEEDGVDDAEKENPSAPTMVVLPRPSVASGSNDKNELSAFYPHSEAARLREAKVIGAVIVPDLNGKISMDGDYWKISETGRSRRRRELEFFPKTLKVGSSAPYVPRAPLSPESQERRRAEQSRVTAERRQEREERQARDNEEFAELVTFLSHGREVVTNVFLGGEIAAENNAWVQENVDFVVNISGKRFAYAALFGEERVLTIDVDDNVHSDLMVHFVTVADRVHERVTAGARVFVHCRQGRSRSAALLAAYLVLKHSMTLSEALELISEKNRGHNINDGFLRQLQNLECSHLGLATSSIFQSKESRRAPTVNTLCEIGRK